MRQPQWCSFRVAIGTRTACVVAVLAGCTSDPDGGPDTTLPTVIVTNPPAGATHVSVSTNVTAGFSESMDPATIDGTSFLLDLAGAPIASTVTYDGATAKATCTPAAQLLVGQTYTATILSTARDLAGNPLAANHVWTFTTNADPKPLWDPLGGQVSSAGAGVEDPTMLVVSSVPAVGYRADSYETRISYWNGAGWNPPTPDPTGGNTNTSLHGTPAFCSGGDLVYMACSRAGDPASPAGAFYDRIFVHSWSPSGGWSTYNGGAEVSVPWDPVLGGADAYEPAIFCSAGSPTVTVGWAEMDVGSPDGDDEAMLAGVGSTTSSAIATFERNTAVSPYSSDVLTMAVARRGLDPLFVAHWERNAADADRTNFYVSRFDGGVRTDLGGNLASDYDSNNLGRPSIVVTDRDVYAAIDVTTGGEQEVYVFRHDGASWSVLGGSHVRAFKTFHAWSRAPDLVMAGDTLYLAWEEASDYIGPLVFIARWDAAGGAWVIDGEIVPQLGSSVIDPDLADSAGDGRLYCAYTELIGGIYSLLVAQRGL